MPTKLYDNKVTVNKDTFHYRPRQVIMPPESYKYISTKWNPEYTMFRLAYLTYGDPDLYWLILEANNITNYSLLKNGDELQLLLPEYTNEVVVGDGDRISTS